MSGKNSFSISMPSNATPVGSTGRNVTGSKTDGRYAVYGPPAPSLSTNANLIYHLGKQDKNENNRFLYDVANDFYNKSIVNADRIYERNVRNQKELMDYNLKNFNTALEYDRYMSNTQYQRAVEDLKKAGLNPVLAAKIGGAVYHGAGNFATFNNLATTPFSAMQMPIFDLKNSLSSAVEYMMQENILPIQWTGTILNFLSNIIGSFLRFSSFK